MLVLISLLSGVTLLTYGIYLVKSGVMRVFGSQLGALIARSLSGRLWPLKALLTGVGITALVQSSNATALLVSSFMQKGLVALIPALLIMLGADVGSAVMARVLTFDLSWLSPLCLIVGINLFLRRKSTRAGKIGRIIIGLGLILLALKTIVATTAPISQSETMQLILTSLEGEFTFAILMGALLAMLCYSSLAAVLITALLAAHGSLSLVTALYIVIGANLGSCVLEILGSLSQGVEARRVMTSNLFFKLTLALPCCLVLNATGAQAYGLELSSAVIWFHVIFNVALCLSMAPLTPWYARLLKGLFPDVPETQSGEIEPRYLDEQSLDNPTLATSNAIREILHAGGFLHQMLGLFKESLTGKTGHSHKLAELSLNVEKLCMATRNYIVLIEPGADARSERWNQCLAAVMATLAAAEQLKRIQADISFVNHSQEVSLSAHSRSDLTRLTGAVNESLALSLNALMTGRSSELRGVMERREAFKAECDRYARRQLERLSSSDYGTDTGAVMLSLIDDLRLLNGCFIAIAVPGHALDVAHAPEMEEIPATGGVPVKQVTD